MRNGCSYMGSSPVGRNAGADVVGGVMDKSIPNEETLDPMVFADFAQQPYMCLACGETGILGFDPTAKDVGFPPCSCGVEGQTVKTCKSGLA